MPFATGSLMGQVPASYSLMPRSHRVFVTWVFALCIFPQIIHSTVYMAHHCGRTIRSAGDMIFSQGGLYYTSNTNCTVTIETLNNEGYVLLQFTDIDLKSNDNCTDDYIELTHVQGKNSLGEDVTTQTVCGRDGPKEIVSIGSFLQIHLMSDGSLNGRGWAGVFTTVIASGVHLCLSHDRYRCSNGRCIASSLRCDSVNHCGDASDETVSCKDDLPEYLGNQITDGKKALYIVLGIIFTIVFIFFFTVQCIRDTIIKVRRRIKLLMMASIKDVEVEKPKTPEDELRETLMASLYDRRASQPYEVTLNTITGGELARQLKLQLQQDKTQVTVKNREKTADEPDTVKVINFKRFHKPAGGVNSTSEVLSLLENENYDTNSESWEFDVSPGPNSPSEKDALARVIPSVVVSEHGDEKSKVVLFNPQGKTSDSCLVIPNTEPQTSLPKTCVSRFQVSTIPEPKPSPSRASSSDKSGSSKSRFSVTANSEETQPPPEKQTSIRFSPMKSKFAVTVVDENKPDKRKDITNQRMKDITTTGRLLEVPRVRRGLGGEQKTETLQASAPKASRFTVLKVEEDPKSEQQSKTIFDKLETHARRGTNREYITQYSEPNTLTSAFGVHGGNAAAFRGDFPTDENNDVITTAVTIHGFPGYTSTRSWNSTTRRTSYETHL